MVNVLRFSAFCQRCRCEVDQGTFSIDILNKFILNRTLRFYCDTCDVEWDPSQNEFAELRWLLESDRGQQAGSADAIGNAGRDCR